MSWNARAVCNRYVYIGDRKVYIHQLEVRHPMPDDVQPSWNVAPTHHRPVVLNIEGERAETWGQWGFWPSWDKGDYKHRPTCVRSEDIYTTTRMWRAPMENRRAIAPINGFFEWIGDGKKKLPFYLHPASGEPWFYVPALWDVRETLEGELLSFAMVMTAPNATLARFHDRAPAVLTADEARAWLDPTTTAERAHAMLRPFPAEWVAARAVSPRVNASHGSHYVNEPSLIEPADNSPAQRSLFGAA